MKKFLTFLFAVMIFVSIPVSASAEVHSEKSSEQGVFYIDPTSGFGSGEDGHITPYTRSSCFELYSKEWCHAHGYYNNRPVAPKTKVKLTEREKKCIIRLYGDMGAATVSGVVFPDPVLGLFFCLC